MGKISMIPEVKVTITVEGMETVDTFIIPLASKVEYSVDNTLSLNNGHFAERRFALSCFALYDIDQNTDILHFQTKRLPRAYHIPDNIILGEN